MRTIQTQVNIKSDRKLNIQLPEDIESGDYQVVITISQQTPNDTTIPKTHNLNQLSGKITAFKNIDALAWQQITREEWDEPRLSD